MLRRTSTRLQTTLLTALWAGAVALASCSSDKSADGPDAAISCNPSGGAVSGPPDTHCTVDGGLFVQSTTVAGCNTCDIDAGSDTVDDGGIAVDAGCYVALGYAAPSYGMAANTQGCKYAVSWTSTPTEICENSPVYFMVTGKHLSDGSPVTGANPAPDVTLNCDHPIQNAPSPNSPEGPPGTYKVGPIVFDQPGRWIVRFHFYPNCCQLVPESMHDHASFWVDVP